ncbi:MAG: hypothetical protein FJX18_06315 [Alphaproteobacteria bacterium]|nr:hypothetical protein [Alphaproteobacteria bacterium]
MIKKEVSAKNTKEQILAAYEESLAKLKEKQENPQETKKKQEEKNLVEKASSHSQEGILSDLSVLKGKSLKQLDTIAEELLKEFQKLTEIRQAIIVEQKHLETLYQIHETAHTLSALIQSQKEQKELFDQEMGMRRKEFEEEMNQKKRYWKEESDLFDKQIQEQKAASERSRKREEEEYLYALEIKRRKESDDYTAKKALIEKDLTLLQEVHQKREDELKNKEETFLTLEARVAGIGEEIQKAIFEAEEKVKLGLSKDHTIELTLKEKEYKSTLALYEQKIESLKEKVKEQEDFLRETNQKADQAIKQVQLIACRALDSARPEKPIIKENV